MGYLTLELLRERPKQVDRLYEKGIKVMQIVAMTLYVFLPCVSWPICSMPVVGRAFAQHFAFEIEAMDSCLVIRSALNWPVAPVEYAQAATKLLT